MKPTRSEFLHSVFVTALEGGINYWATVEAYHWRKPDAPADADVDTASDYENFYATVYDHEADDGDPSHKSLLRIDAALIELGLARIRSADPGIHLHRDYIRNIFYADAYYDRDDWDLDALEADAIIQVGLFGDVIYG